MIDEILAKQDAAELVRDQIAAILAVEIAAAASPPLRVFSERANPWEEWIDAPDQDAQVPIVSVSWDSANYEMAASSVVDRQRGTAVYNLDCYGYGVSEDVVGGGHEPADRRAALEVHKAIRIVRNILQAGQYTYLGMRGMVGRRWIRSVSIFQPQLGDRPIQAIVGARIALEVLLEERSPQVTGEALELISATVTRAETGEVIFVGSYDGAGFVAFATQHFNIGKIGSPAVAPTPGTPDAGALSVFSQVNVPNDEVISVIHLHGIEDKASGSMSIEVFRRRGGVMTSLGIVSLTGGGGDFATASLIPSDAAIEAGDYLFAQLTAFNGAGGYDGITVDVHFQ